MAGQALLNKQEVHFGSVRNRIEGLATQGHPVAKIAEMVGSTVQHVENIVRCWRHQMRKPDPVFCVDHAQRDETYWRACRDEGGFPYAYTMKDGRTVHVYPDLGRGE